MTNPDDSIQHRLGGATDPEDEITHMRANLDHLAQQIATGR